MITPNPLLEPLKPFIKQFVRYYYEYLGYSTGGSLHIALDDGNLSDDDIFFCGRAALEEKDSFGFFLTNLLMHFTEEEREKMYDDDWWGMSSVANQPKG